MAADFVGSCISRPRTGALKLSVCDVNVPSPFVAVTTTAPEFVASTRLIWEVVPPLIVKNCPTERSVALVQVIVLLPAAEQVVEPPFGVPVVPP
jgi:hypothetical protein